VRSASSNNPFRPSPPDTAGDTASETKRRLEQLEAVHAKLVNESRLLQEKYYRQKQQFHSLLWTSMSENPSALGPIPPIDKALLDPGGGGDGGGAVVGAYTCGALIGRGQFASVRACTRTRDKTEWAIKIVKKSRLTKLSHVKRMKVRRRLAERV